MLFCNLLVERLLYQYSSFAVSSFDLAPGTWWYAQILGVIVDSQLTMADHVLSLCRSVYHQLRPLRPVVRSITEELLRW